MLDPNTLPIARSALPLDDAKILITNSGAEVPKETIVNPITKSETSNFFAREEAPSTIQLDPITTRTNPNINKSIFIILEPVKQKAFHFVCKLLNINDT